MRRETLIGFESDKIFSGYLLRQFLFSPLSNIPCFILVS
jgi:hypothetical protein